MHLRTREVAIPANEKGRIAAALCFHNESMTTVRMAD